MRPAVSVTSTRETPVSSTADIAWATLSSVRSARPDRAASAILTLEKSPRTSTDLRICRSTVKVILAGDLSIFVMDEADTALGSVMS